MKVRVKEVMTYNGHNISNNGRVNFSLKAMYDELVNTIQLTQMLNNDIKIKVKGSGIKPMKLGLFRLAKIIIDDDGESTIKLAGTTDYIEMDNLNMLPMKNDDVNKFIVMFEAEIEEEENEVEGE